MSCDVFKLSQIVPCVMVMVAIAVNIIVIMVVLYRWILTLSFTALFGIPALAVHLTFNYHRDDHMITPGLSKSNLILFILATIVQVRIT